MKNKKSRLLSPTVDRLYFILSGLLILAAIAFIGLTKGKNFELLFWHGSTLGIYPDLFESVIQARTRDPYMLDAIYPAIAYCILYPFNFFIPGTYKDSFDDLAEFCSHTETLVIAHIFYAVITVTIAYLMVKLYGKEKDVRKYLLIFVFLFSAPFIFLIERGNTVIITIAFLFVYFLYYQSEDKRKRELALICLAVAASMKIYPAVFGLLLLADKRIKEAIHAVVYGVIAFVVPFFFMGGVGKIPQMLKNAFSLNTNSVSGSTGFGYGFKVNATNSIASIFDWLFDDSHATHIKVAVYVLMMLLVIGSLVIKTEWKRVAALSLVVILMPDFSFIYNVIYLLIPLVLFIREKKDEKLTVPNIFYTLCFVGAFAPLPYGEFFRSIGGYNNMNWSTMISSLSLLALAVAFAVQGVIALSKTRFIVSGKVLTAGALVVSLVFGMVPLVLSGQDEPEIHRNEKIWTITAEEEQEVKGLVDFIQSDLEKDAQVVCFPKTATMQPFDSLEEHLWFSMVDKKDAVTNYKKLYDFMPQFVAVNLTGYDKYKYLIKEEEVKQTQYEQHMAMQRNLLDFLNDEDYSVVKYVPLENGTVVGVWELTKYADDLQFWNDGGDGTKDSPYQLSSAEQLAAMSYISNCGDRFDEEYIELTQDIDASAVKNMMPIAYQNDVSVFYGCLDGKGHTLSRLTMESISDNDEAGNVSLVNFLAGRIINLSIEDSVFTGNCAAPFARYSSDPEAEIANCISRNNVMTGKRTGEIADKYGAKITNCVAIGNRLKYEKSQGFISVKDATANIFNCYSDHYDDQHNAAYVTADYINSKAMADSLNSVTEEYREYQIEKNEKYKKSKKKEERKLVKDWFPRYAGWALEDGVLTFE